VCVGDAGHVGYVITVKSVKIYHTGDSDFIPEMKGLKPDVAQLPVSGTYVMTAEEAIEAATAIQPKGFGGGGGRPLFYHLKTNIPPAAICTACHGKPD
jgi:hypothetical protein